MKEETSQSGAPQLPKVLLVDDEPFNLKVLKLKFENAGYQVILAENGKEGLEKFEQERPAVVITDIKMPVLDGRDLCQKLPNTGDYLLIVVTSSVDEGTREWMCQSPAAVFMEKPISPRNLVERVNHYFSQHPQRTKQVSLSPSGNESKSPKSIPAAWDQDPTATELTRRYEELNLIYKIGNSFRLSENLEAVLTELMGETAICVDADIAILYVRSKHLSLEKNTASTIELFLSESDLFRLKKAIGERLKKECQQFLIQDTKGVSSLKTLPSMKLLVSPIPLDSEPNGGYMALLRDSRKRDFVTGDLRFLTLVTNHGSVMITNAALYLESKQLLYSVVSSLSDAIEAKNIYGRGHNERISEISFRMGQAFGLANRDLELLRWAAVLHDIGMIGIPESILTKPGSLSPGEFSVLKQHPEKGYEILNHIEALQDALTGVLFHHEKFDGSGYPRGLKGKEIPLFARILSVADTYVSMTCGRAYQKARPHESALQEVVRIAGSQLDPEIVTVFKKLMEEDPNLRWKSTEDSEKPRWG